MESGSKRHSSSGWAGDQRDGGGSSLIPGSKGGPLAT